VARQQPIGAGNTPGQQRLEGLAESARQQQQYDTALDRAEVLLAEAVTGRSEGVFDWGAYAPAIRRWEATIGLRAPSPVERGTRGQPRLTSGFVEWLMGLRTGYVTQLGLPRSAELRALGNGVVPQQADRALKMLMSEIIRHHTPR
jgi:DNA (cytosine-5)-methyltransferase 1